MKKVAITGAKGIIGTVLVNELTGYEISQIDLPETDARDYDKLLKAVTGTDVIIHLAWNTATENWRSIKNDPDNLLMAKNIYKAAIEANVSRVIIASSVHADNYKEWKGPGLMTTNKPPKPQNAYGKSKVKLENFGKQYAAKGLEVICIRFGGVNKENVSPKNEIEKKVWLSHEDCITFVKKYIEVKDIPNNFLISYAISENDGKIHETMLL